MHFHMPEVLPHENLYTLVTRFAKLNGFTRHLLATQSFFSCKDISIADTHLLPIQESPFQRYYHGHENSHLLTFEWLRNQLGEVLQDGGDPIKKSTLQNESFGDVSYWRYCPICLERDRNLHGVGLWHLAHQLPTTLICIEHQTNLQEITLKKKFLHDRLWLLDEVLQFKKAVDDPLNDHWFQIALLGKTALAEVGTPFASWVIRQTIIAALRQRRLIDGKSSLKIRVFEDAFLHFFGENFILMLKHRLQIKQPRYLVTELLHGFKGRALNRLILIYWLFGSWQFFRSCCAWTAVFEMQDFKTGQAQASHGNKVELATYTNRQLCESYLLSTDKPNRVEFCRTHYGCFRWLVHNDREWFDRALPSEGYFYQWKLKY